MLTVSQRNQIEYLLEDIVEATTGKKKDNRKFLADVYEVCVNAGGYFPRKPLSMTINDVRTLRKKTCSYCPSKIKPAQMKVYVEQAKGKLLEYQATIKKFLEESEVEADQPSTEPPTDIHDLESTI